MFIDSTQSVKLHSSSTTLIVGSGYLQKSIPRWNSGSRVHYHKVNIFLHRRFLGSLADDDPGQHWNSMSENFDDRFSSTYTNRKRQVTKNSTVLCSKDHHWLTAEVSKKLQWKTRSTQFGTRWTMRMVSLLSIVATELICTDNDELEQGTGPL